MDELSIIVESREQGKQEEKQMEGLEEMLRYLSLFEQELLALEELQEEMAEEASQKDSGLTSKLRRIKVFAEGKGSSRQMGDFLFSKYKNLVRCFVFHQSATLEDYSLLFDILHATCQNHHNFPLFIQKLQKVTEGFSAKQPHNLTHSYLQIIYILLKFKLSEKEVEQSEGLKLKKCCLRDPLNILPQFALKIILRKEIKRENLTFLRDLIGHSKYDKLVRKKQEGSLIGNSKAITCETIHSQDREQQKPAMPSAQTKSQNINQSRVCVEIIHENSLLSPPTTPKHPNPSSPQDILISKIKQVQLGKSNAKALKEVIQLISTKDMKEMPECRELMVKLLQTSFKLPDLMPTTIEKALYLMSIDDFITQMKKLFKDNHKNPEIQIVKRAIIRELKQYCGKDSYLHFWSKMYTEDNR